jgi:hypothetical protein
LSIGVSKPSLTFEDQPVIVTWSLKTHMLDLHWANRRMKTLQNQAINVDSAFRRDQWRYQREEVKTFLTNSLAPPNFDGFATKADLGHEYKSTWRFLERWCQLKVPQYTSRSSKLQKMKKQEDLKWSPPTQRQEEIDHWLLGLTCALVVRKHRGLRRQIRRAYQDRSKNALVYQPQRIAISRLKVYTNIKLQDTIPRIEDPINIHEGNNNHKTTKATQEASTLQDVNLRARNLLTLEESFRAY